MNKSKITSRIIILQYQITQSVLKGHKSNDCDEFKENRKELMELRCKLFGKKSKICKTEKDNFRTCNK